MELLYNKFFLNITGNKKNNDILPSDVSKSENSDFINNTTFSDSPKENKEFDDNDELPSSISSIDSINSDLNDSDNSHVNIKKVKFNDDIKILESIENESPISVNNISAKTESYENNSENISVESNNKTESTDDMNEKKISIESVIEKKYLSSMILNKKHFYEEIKELNFQNYRILELNTLKNSYPNVLNSLSNGEVLYKRDDNYNIIKICSNKNCNGQCEKKQCYKSGLYYSLWNNARGVKTIYNLLLKLIIIYPQFRIRCKCCENKDIKLYLDKLEVNFNKNEFNYKEGKNNKLELKISYLINKFMSVVGIMTCQCKFSNKYQEFYQDKYLNFRKIFKIYKRTIPYIFLMLKNMFNIKENHEEITLIKESRCIHEDIRYNNMTYCLKYKYNNVNTKKLMEIINNLELVNFWTMDSFKITLLLFNEQSLETFRNALFRHKKEIHIVDFFKKVYDKKNSILNLNFMINKTNLINSIFSTLINEKISGNKNTLGIDQAKKLVSAIISQLYRQNKKYRDYQARINEMMIQYLIECFRYDHYVLGIEFLKNIKEINYLLLKINEQVNYDKYSIINLFPSELNKNSRYNNLLKYIFDKILESNINYLVKISYLKIINKNKINIINYDFINKLIDLPEGDKIILALSNNNDSENYYLNIPDYKNITHITLIIKKCIIKQRVNILNYLLSEINNKISKNDINPYIIYFSNIEDYRKEHEYIELLKVIVKYNYNINEYISSDKLTNKKNISFLHFCIKNKLNKSAQILIQKSINISTVYDNKNYLFYCIDNKNHIVFNEILNNHISLTNDTYNNFKMHTYIFIDRELGEDFKMRFLINLLSSKSININYYDKNNLHIGFQILESNIDKRNKVMLFKIISELIDPMTIKNNIPLILYSVIMDEYEITYMLLDKVFKSKGIKKNSIHNSYLDYEYITDKININFIPLIFKYIKENKKENKIIIDKIYLESDTYYENILVMIMEIVNCILFYKSDSKNITNKLRNEDNDMINSYIENKQEKRTKITNSIISNTNGYVEISIDTDEVNNDMNKNIWKNVKNKTDKSLDNKKTGINFKSESESSDLSDLSEIEESNICFENLI